MDIKGKHRTTWEAVFAEPVRSSISWCDIEALLVAAGAEISEGRGSRVRVALNGVRAVFHRPHPQKETDKGEVDTALSRRSRDQAMTTMNYDGYEAIVEYDDDAEIFHGEVINLRDVITFQGQSVGELQQAFRDSVEDYLAFCRERGEEPEKPFSGQFLVRTDPALHRAMFTAAKRSGTSLNKWIISALERAVAR